MRRGVCVARCPCRVLPRRRGFALIPVWITGGIHLDGYADTCDALSSYGDREKKLEILKDPHCGAFAVIRLCSYFLAYFCPVHLCEFYTPRGCAVGSGTCAGTGAFGPCGGIVPHGKKHRSCTHTFATAADKTAVRRVLAVLAAVLCVGMAALGGWALVLAALLRCSGATTP